MDSDSSSDSQELFPIVNNQYLDIENAVFQYEDPRLVSGVLRAVVEEDLNKIEDMVASGKSVNINDNNGNTPLHVAVIKNDLKILDYLLTQEDICVNIRNFRGETPLYQSVKAGQLESTVTLIKAGANVNLPNYEDVTPLHVAVTNPNIAHILIQHGAHIDPLDFLHDTPLHDAVAEECLETVCMLLYYNADANACGGNDLTPFMKSLISENLEIQQALFEYVSDFNTSTTDHMSTLALALTHNTLYVEDIIRNGANVNYADSYLSDEVMCAYTLCLRVPDSQKFKLIWEKLNYNAERNSINICDLFEYLHGTVLAEYIQTIADGDNIKVAVDSFSKNDNFNLCINKFAETGLDLDQLTKLTCQLILNGYHATSYDIYAIFTLYGYCELFRILLYMDNNYSQGWVSHMFLPKLIFDFNFKICDLIVIANAYKRDLERLLEYSVYPSLINGYMCMYKEDEELVQKMHKLPKVPFLIELARDKTREFIAKRFSVTSTCEFYTILNHLDIPYVCKKVLTFEKKLYKI